MRDEVFRLVRETDNVCPWSSRLNDRVPSEPFQALLALGDEAVPHLLAFYQSGEPSWTPLMVLNHLVPAAEGPVIPDDARGRLAVLMDLWVAWGVAKGHLRA